MGKNLMENTGIQLLLDKYKRKFRISENLKYYSKKDYPVAEKKFIKYALNRGKVQTKGKLNVDKDGHV